jgi:CHAD domain-containing protein
MQLFHLSAAPEFSSWEKALSKRFSLAIDAARPFRRLYLDSFDRRIAAAGESAHEGDGAQAVERDFCGRESSLRWLDAEGRLLEAHCASKDELRFAEDLPECELRTQLASLLDLRALLPLLELKGRETTLRVLDDEQKTVVRGSILELEAHDAEHERRAELGNFLLLRPLRGYGAEFDRVVRALRKKLDLEDAPSLLDLGLEAIGRHSFGQALGLPSKLDPDLPAQQALRDVLRVLCQTIRANEPGVREQLDTEFLHDLRVAVRRTRSALQRFGGVLPKEATRVFAEGFAWIGAETGPLRDLDVHLLEFDDHSARLDDAARRELEPLRELLHVERVEAHSRLMRVFDSKRYRRLLDDWEAWLERKPRKRDLLAEGVRPIGELAPERAARLLDKLLRDGRRIHDDSPAERVHDLRKLGKKTRYALELFRGVYPKDAYRSAIRTMKVLQDNLGKFNDLEVQQASLSALGRRLLEQKRGSSETLIVMGRMVDDLARRQVETRRDFATCFAVMDSDASHAQFAALFEAARGSVSKKPKAKPKPKPKAKPKAKPKSKEKGAAR